MIAEIRKRVAVIVYALGAVLILFFHYKQRDSYECDVCFSKKHEFQWRLGSWSRLSVPLTPRWNKVAETSFFHDFFASNHVHDWTFAQGSPYHFFGTTWAGCAIGGGQQMSALAHIYEADPGFRAFILGKVRDGSLARSNVIALMLSTTTVDVTDVQKQADALLDAYFAR